MAQSKTARKTENRPKGSAGTSIIEVMIALAVFAVFAVGTCKLLIAQRKVLDMARDHYVAANLAKSRMELARTFDFEQLPELAESQILMDESGVPSVYGNFRRTTQITALRSNLYEMAIVVDIKNRNTLEFAPGEQTINTYVSKRL